MATARRSQPDPAEPAPPAPPANDQTEAALIGALLTDRDAIVAVADLVEPDDLTDPDCRLAYQAIRDLYNVGTPADVVLAEAELARRGWLETTAERLARLFAWLDLGSQTAVHVVYYAQQLADLAHRRRLIRAGAQIVGLGYQSDRPLAEVIAGADQALQAAGRVADLGAWSMPDLAAATLAAMDAEADDPGSGGLPSGFIDLDRLTGSYRPGEVVIVAARPSVGKTAWALANVHHLARHQVPVGVFSLEMSGRQLFHRLLALETRLDLKRIGEADLLTSEWAAIDAAASRLSALPIHIDDRPGLTVTELRYRARRMVAEHGVRLLVLDYLQLLGTPGRRQDNRSTEVGDQSRMIKALARELAIPILVVCQLNRAVEGRADNQPRLSDLRESGQLEQDADRVYLLSTSPDSAAGAEAVATLTVAKHRQGPTGVVQLSLVRASAAFGNLARGDQMDW